MSRAPTLHRRVGHTFETKKAAHRFSAIRMRSLNDPHRVSLPSGGQHSPGRVKRWHATPGAYAAAVTSAISAIHRQHRWTGATVSGRDRSTILTRARFQVGVSILPGG